MIVAKPFTPDGIVQSGSTAQIAPSHWPRWWIGTTSLGRVPSGPSSIRKGRSEPTSFLNTPRAR